MQPTDPPKDIAIIGLACRFPAAANPRAFWRLIREGREAPENRIDNVADFDADFFNLSPREASAMDPRQRLALELTWELLEDAFIVPETVRGEHVAVYLGAMNDDYAILSLRDAADNVDHRSFGGISRGMIANRISYAFGMHGSSMTIDSGQSSSLVAVHLACESLRTGACPLAIAGGVHLNLADETAMLELEFGAVSATGHTYAFDARADGYVPSEGGALVLLKPLTAARKDGNRIRAVIRGSAVGNAGHSAAALTVPSVTSELDVIRRALSDARLDSAAIDYVEAHGTGTEAGDPIEATALGEVFAERRHRPVSVGSVKTNIGHTGAAAGVAGLLKTVLAIENGVIPASLNYAGSHPELDPQRLGLRVNTMLTPWPAQRAPRRAGVSSFGMGGTNAHVVLEQAPVVEEVVAERNNGSTTLPWVVSARSPQGLAGQAGRLLAYLGEYPEVDAADVGFSLVTTRSVLEHRAVVVGAGREALTAGLASLAAGEPSAGVAAGRAHPVGTTVLVFPGQGTQWLGMGRSLYDRFPLFASIFDDAVAALDGHLRLPLRQVMWGKDSTLLESTEFAQPALFAVEVALAELLRQCGVIPAFVMGHSVGEISAAHVAGVLSLADAAKVVATRGRLMAALPAGGAMVAVVASEDEVAPLLAEGVDIAAVNGPESVVLSGQEAAVGAVADRFASQGRRVRRLAVSHAFHSALMEPMMAEFSKVAAEVSLAAPRIGLVSNVSGQLAGPAYGSPSYWTEHVRQPVRFSDGVRSVESLGAGVFVEVGPAGGLMAAVEQSSSAQQAVTVAALVKDRPEVDSVLGALGRMCTAGVAVDWSPTFRGLGGRRVELPTYAFERQRFWLGEAASAKVDRTDIIGARKRLQGLEPDERSRQLVELVRLHAAIVLGHSESNVIDAERPFQDLGFDSLTGVELRDRLKTETGLAGLALSRTLIFDYPTPSALAEYLGQQLSGGNAEESDDAKVWSRLRKIPIHELRRTGLLEKLLLLAGEREKSLLDSTMTDDAIDSLSADDLIAMALNKDDEDTL